MSADQAIKQPCRVATTGNITLSGLSTIDGVTLSAGDRVLVRAQTSAVNNGIYDAASGSWTRSTDFDGAGEVVGGTQVLVTSGDVNAGRAFRVGGATAITINTSPIDFEAATYTVSVMDFIPATDHAAILGFSGGAPNVTTYVAAAQDALVARGGGVLDFPAGLFRISGFELENNVNLRGVNAGGQYGLLWSTGPSVGTVFAADGTGWIVHQDTDKMHGSVIGIDFIGNGAEADDGGVLMEGYRFAVADCSFYFFANQGLKFGGIGGRVTNIGVFDCVKHRARMALTGALEGVGFDSHVAFIEVAGGILRSEGADEDGITNKTSPSAFTADRASGSIQLTGASTTTGFQEGDRVTGSGIQTGTEIAAIVGSIIFLNLAATSTADDETYYVSRHNLWFCAYLDGGSNTENSHIVAGLAERGIHSLTYTNRYTACRADRNYGPGWSGTFAADASCIAFDNSQAESGVYDGFEITLPGARGDGCQASSSGAELYGEIRCHRYGCNGAVGTGTSPDRFRPIFNDFRSSGQELSPIHDHIYAIGGFSGVRGTRRGTGSSIDFANLDCYVPDDGSPVTITSATNLVVGQVYKIFGNANVTLQHGTYFELNGGANLTLTARKVYVFVAAQDYLGTNFLSQVNATGVSNRPGSVTFVSSGTAAVSFGTAEPDSSYRITLSGNANETFRWSSKSTTGFTILSSNGSSTATVDWVISR